MKATIFLAFLQILIQLIAAYYSYAIYRFNRLHKAWLAIVFALLLMTLRRITVLMIELELFPKLTGTVDFVDKFVLPLAISIFLLLGLWSMKKNFETFEIVEKKAKVALKRFVKKG